MSFCFVWPEGERVVRTSILYGMKEQGYICKLGGCGGGRNDSTEWGELPKVQCLTLYHRIVG